MAWNHKSRIVAIGIAIQPVAGTFTTPTASDMIAASNVTNSNSDVTAEDPTLTGTGWESEPIVVGEEGQIGFTMALRGPGGAAPPAANGWVPGRVLQSAGWTEVITTTPVTGTMQAGGTTTTFPLAVTASSVDDFYNGMPIQAASIAASGFKQTTMIADYVGSTRLVSLAETLGGAASGTFTIPANLLYLEGALKVEGPLLSVRIWRDKKIYDYKDVRVESLQWDFPVANNNNTTFSSLEVSGKGNVVDVTDGTTPTLASSLIALDIAPCKNGKFTMDKVMLGHNSLRYGNALSVAAPSNIHSVDGQDAYETISGTRTIEIDVNQMDNTTFNARAKRNAGTVMPIMQTWGNGAGNNFGFTLFATKLRQLNPGDSNGFVNLTGNSVQASLDKSAALAIWW